MRRIRKSIQLPVLAFFIPRPRTSSDSSEISILARSFVARSRSFAHSKKSRRKAPRSQFHSGCELVGPMVVLATWLSVNHGHGQGAVSLPALSLTDRSCSQLGLR